MKTHQTLIAVCTILLLGACDGRAANQGSLLTSATKASSAAKSEQTRTGGPERMLLRLVHDQDLSTQQEQQLLAIRAGLTEQWHQLHAAVDAAMPQLRGELAKTSPDARTVHALVDQALAMHAKMAHATADQVLALHSTFSGPQRDLLASRFGEGMTRDGFVADLKAETTARVPTAQPLANAKRAQNLRPDRMVLALFTKKGLNPEQKSQLKAARRHLRAQWRQLDDLIDASTTALLTEVQKPTPDAAVVHAMVDQALAKYREIAYASADRAIKLRATLSDSQVATLALK